MTDPHSKAAELLISTNEPFAYAAEVVLQQPIDPEMVAAKETELAGALGIDLQPDGNVLITLVNEEDEHVNLEIRPSDFKCVQELVQLCDQRITADEATRRADAEWESDSA